jgi:hypothetical protein
MGSGGRGRSGAAGASGLASLRADLRPAVGAARLAAGADPMPLGSPDLAGWVDLAIDKLLLSGNGRPAIPGLLLRCSTGQGMAAMQSGFAGP